MPRKIKKSINRSTKPKKSVRKSRKVKKSVRKLKKSIVRKIPKYGMNMNSEEENAKHLFESCAVESPFEKLDHTQKFYNAFMKIGICYLRKTLEDDKELMAICNSILHDQSGDKNVKRMFEMELAKHLFKVVGKCVKHLYISRTVLELESNMDFSGVLPWIDKSKDIYKQIRRDRETLFLPTGGGQATVISLKAYPIIEDLLKPYFEKAGILQDIKHVQTERDGTVLSTDNPDIIHISIPIGKYQNLGAQLTDNGDYVFYIYHPNIHDNRVQIALGNIFYQFMYAKLTNQSKDILRQLAFYVYYLFVNSVYYFEGTAGSAKVLLNTLLTMSELPIVYEKRPYCRQADWIAFTVKDFNDFYEKMDDVFTSDEEKCE